MRCIRFEKVLASALTFVAAVTMAGFLAAPVRAIDAEQDTVLPEDAVGTEFTRSSLARFKFEGLTFATTEEQFKKAFPKAQLNKDQVDEKLGLHCYTVGELKNADSAQFYFIAGKLYQLEANYKMPRLEAQGGVQAVVNKLVKEFGPPDGVFGNRRTWQQPNIGYRADFYTSRVGAQLVVTNTNYSAIVNERETKTGLEENVELGF